jgi:hypothetical protein
LPYAGTETQMMDQQLRGPPPSRPSMYAKEPLDERADALVMRSIARDPAERQPAAEAFHYELRAFMSMMGMRVRRQAAAPVEEQPVVPARAEVVEAAILASPIPMAVIELDGGLRFANPAFLEVADGAVSDQVQRFEALRLVRTDPTLVTDLRRVVETSRPVWRVVRAGPAGTEGPLLMLLAPAMKSGQVDSVHATLVDTTLGRGG